MIKKFLFKNKQIMTGEKWMSPPKGVNILPNFDSK
jgi:hypothetical protein